MINAANTYWNSAGKHQDKASLLEKLLPDSGPVDNPRKNPKLERFRKACNCYHDLYNNGLCNRKSEFRQVFGLSSTHYKLGRHDFAQSLYDLTEQRMNEIILEAFEEQQATLVAML